MQRDIVLRLIVLLVLLCPVTALYCFQCEGTLDSCKQTKQLCDPHENLCVSEIRNRTGMEHPVLLTKGCSAVDMCNGTSQSSFVNETESHNVICCHTQLCNTHFLVPPKPWVENGIQCASCYDTGNGQCDSEQTNVTTTKCYGEMKYCLDRAVRAGPQVTVAKGCASGDMCQGDLTLFSPTRNIIVYCCSGSMCNLKLMPRRTTVCKTFHQKDEGSINKTDLECYSCCETGKGECTEHNSSKVMTAQCSGLQNRCISITDDNGSRTILRGCISERNCKEANNLFGLGLGSKATCCPNSLCNFEASGVANPCPSMMMMVWITMMLVSAFL